jgi:hypothetical protein
MPFRSHKFNEEARGDFPYRLHIALERVAGGSLKWLRIELRNRGMDVAYQSILRYARGDRQAPLDFVEMCAKVLGVDAGWLAFGLGSQPHGLDALVLDERRLEIHRTLKKVAPRYQELPSNVADTLLKAVDLFGIREGTPNDAKLVAEYLQSGVKAAGMEECEPADFDPHSFDRFVTLATSALAVLRMAPRVMEDGGQAHAPPGEADAE